MSTELPDHSLLVVLNPNQSDRDSVVRCPDHLFVARGLTVGAPDREGTEAVEKVVRGEIVQASSLVLIPLADLARVGRLTDGAD